jgi:hypothetical protein
MVDFDLEVTSVASGSENPVRLDPDGVKNIGLIVQYALAAFSVLAPTFRKTAPKGN